MAKTVAKQFFRLVMTVPVAGKEVREAMVRLQRELRGVGIGLGAGGGLPERTCQ